MESKKTKKRPVPIYKTPPQSPKASSKKAKESVTILNVFETKEKDRKPIEIKEPSHVLYYLDRDVENEQDPEDVDPSYVVISDSLWKKFVSDDTIYLLDKIESACMVFRVIVESDQATLYDTQKYKLMLNDPNILSFRVVDQIDAMHYLDNIPLEAQESEEYNELEKFFSNTENRTIEFVKKMRDSSMFTQGFWTNAPEKVSFSSNTSLVSFTVYEYKDVEPKTCLISLHPDYLDKMKEINKKMFENRVLRSKFGEWLLKNQEKIGETILGEVKQIVEIDLKDMDKSKNQEFIECSVVYGCKHVFECNCFDEDDENDDENEDENENEDE